MKIEDLPEVGCVPLFHPEEGKCFVDRRTIGTRLDEGWSFEDPAEAKAAEGLHQVKLIFAEIANRSDTEQILKALQENDIKQPADLVALGAEGINDLPIDNIGEATAAKLFEAAKAAAAE